MIRPDPAEPNAVLIRVKVIPGARADTIVGPLGDRLKVRVSAPPEQGKANAAVLALLAASLGSKPAALELVAGHANPEKTVRVRGFTVTEVAERLGLG